MPNPLSADLDYILECTRDLWEHVRGKRIFVTGGTGFFGCWLLESFCWANDHLDLHASVTVLTRNPGKFALKVPHLAAHPAIQLHVDDVRTFTFPAGGFMYVIHAATAASAQLNFESPLTMLDTIIDGTRHTLDFARQCGSHRFLLTSSGAVYGKQPPEVTHIPEDYPGAPDPLDPRSAYGEGKRLAEHLCVLYAAQFGIQALIARCFAFVGPYLPLDATSAIGNFVCNGLREESIQVRGSGTAYRSYLSTVDLTIWLWTILFNGKSCFPYNVGSDEAITIHDLAKLVADQFTPRPRIEIERQAMNALAGERYIPSIERMRRELGLGPTIGLVEAVRRTIAWSRVVGC